MAIACLRDVTFLPERPERSVPRFRSRIARSTFSDAFFPYLAMRSSGTGSCNGYASSVLFEEAHSAHGRSAKLDCSTAQAVW